MVVQRHPHSQPLTLAVDMETKKIALVCTRTHKLMAQCTKNEALCWATREALRTRRALTLPPQIFLESLALNETRCSFRASSSMQVEAATAFDCGY